ncbi:Predicted kinase, aminoglycoside phosphotransferase (APT) family [Actinacidiphila rubida]|uniref:Predicted kinase, aminoglycoside phosphotransferase (APT) family n=1 Tax=Actinacidiphila rubida TaxID=310780 RepID=A0A1H8S6F2_9ACTN|nr:phosphotransferase [Actinacidiphila rubida]SEO74192.1 Predicted kinase, aminoglycoside phosphotransferase (APT) family [Actinacidiphila rubida]
MTPPRPGTGRLSFTDLPNALRDRIAKALGSPVTHAVTPPGGFGHQLAATLTLADGRRYFTKAAPDDDALTAANLHEAAVLESFPPDAPAASLIGVYQEGGWTAVVIEHLDGTHPDLRPKSADPERVWVLLDQLTSQPAPPAYTEAVSDRPSPAATLHGWTQIASASPADLDPEARARLAALTEIEAAWPKLARGDRIVHGDLRADNMVHDRHKGVIFVDWAHATTGPACIDAVSLAPQLILAGARPGDVAKALETHPASASDPDTATAFLTALTGHWQRNARLPSPPGAPGLRAYQHRAAAAGLSLLVQRLR